MGRLFVVLAVFCMAALVTSSHLLGDVGKQLKSTRIERDIPDPRTMTEAALAKSRFEQDGIVIYQPLEGEPYFALQVRIPPPKNLTVRPRDVLVLISNSAAQAGSPWIASGQIAEAIARAARPEDRIALWTISTPDKLATGSLTPGFISTKDDVKQLEDAFKLLHTRHFPAGDTDLRGGLRKALESFDGQIESRQRIVLFLGDGQSTHNPMTNAARQELCKDMVQQRILFMPVPLGLHLDANNLHGLATGTGGAVLRVDLGVEKLDGVVARLQTAFAQPVLYPTRLQLPAAVSQHYPHKLPPLRPDAPTLVVGRMKAGEKLTYAIDGRVAGSLQPLTITATEAVRPAELDNYFLVSMVGQWKRATDEPALIRADRALVFAFEQNRLNHMELLANGHLAVQENHLAVAEELFEQARQLAPHDPQAKAGLKVVADLRGGKLTREMLRDRLDKRQVDKLEKANGDVRWHKAAFAQIALLEERDAEKLEPKPGREDLLQAQRDRMIVEEQRMIQTVDDNLRQARRELATHPDVALDRLRGTLLRLRDHPDLGDRLRNALLQNVETALIKVTADGHAIKLREAQRRNVLEQLGKDPRRAEAQRTDDERLTTQFESFRKVLLQARVDERTRQETALGLARMQEEARLRGQASPVVVQAAYDQVQAAYNLNKYNDLKKLREKRFLEVYLSVEKSHVPFSDEPGIYYPPLTTWNALSELRKEKYEVFTIPDSESGRREANSIAKLLDESIDMKDFQLPMSLKETLQLLHDKLAASGKDLPILVDSEAFKAENPDAADIYDTQVKFQSFPRRMSVSTALRLALSFVPEGNATYLIRRNFIEITTIERQTQERVLRVFSVGDLVIPITQQGMAGGFGQLGQFGQIGGPGLGQFGQFGQFGAPGFGQQFGQFGAPGFGQNFGQFGQVGQPGQFGVQGFGQLGAGGFNGALGVQGAAQAADLINVITRLVAPGEWFVAPPQQPASGFGWPGGPPVPVGQGGPANIQNANTIEFFPPALALIVRAPSRIHYSDAAAFFGRGKRPFNDPFAVARDRELDVIAGGPRAPKQGNVQVANAGDADKEKLDPETVWQKALAKSGAEPGLIIATADFLFEAGHANHAAEFLKANLRQGIVVRPWVYEALAVALERSGGDVDEIRRARLSAIALDPHDARSFLDAADTMARHNEWDRALAFCRQAALLEPNMSDPYADALVYAEQGRDAVAMEWALEQLLAHDWPSDNQQLHRFAEVRAESFAQILDQEKRQSEANRLREMLRRLQRRDLIVRLAWENGAQPSDVELTVKEPCGSVASFEQRQTAGGGTFLANNLLQLNRIAYTASQAFSGEYEINVQRNWGQPLRNQARLEITEHAGTPKETKTVQVVSLEQPSMIRIKLKEGRRTVLASVPASQPRVNTQSITAEAPGRIMNQLRELAAPDFSGARGDAAPRMHGGSFTPGATLVSGAPNPNQPERVAGQRPWSQQAGVGLAWSTQTATSADRRYIRISMNPVFQTRTPTAEMNLSPIPGGLLR